MSRTRELEMFLNPKELDNLDNCKFGGLTLVSRDGYNYLKVKLIIELPERKVTISESEFDNIAWGMLNAQQFKEKLFKDA